jgi:hypothetical protein
MEELKTQVTPARVALVGAAVANVVTVLSGLDQVLQILLVSSFTVLGAVFMACYTSYITRKRMVETQVNATNSGTNEPK